MTITDKPRRQRRQHRSPARRPRRAHRARPPAAEFTWRATCSWVHGTHSPSTVEGFAGLGQERTTAPTYRFEVDHPECFASQDHGATPVEYVLVGLAGCLTAGVAAVAQHRDDPAPLGHGDDRGRHERARHPRRRPRRPQRLRRRPRPLRHRRRRRREPTSRRSWPSRRSGRRCSTSSPTRPTSSSRSPDRRRPTCEA